MSIGGIPPISANIASITGAGGITQPTDVVATEGTPGSNFGELIKDGMQSVSNAEFQADDLMQTMAAGGDVFPHEVLIATNKASLAVSMAVEVRNKALEAYREIMNMQV